MGRCMTSEVMSKEYPDQKQRVAICTRQSRAGAEKGSLSTLVQEELIYSGYECECKCGLEEELTESNMEKYVFTSKEGAEKKAAEIGLKGAHQHKTGDGATVWMPGDNMKDFQDWYNKHKAW